MALFSERPAIELGGFSAERYITQEAKDIKLFLWKLLSELQN